MNYLSLDTEYTGFYSPEANRSGELLQVSAIAIVDGVRVAQFDEKCKPLTNRWSVEAQAVHKISRSQAMLEQHPKELAQKLIDWVTEFDRIFTVIGWNCSGDQKYTERLTGLIDMNAWLRCVRPKWIDGVKLGKKRKKLVQTPNWRLETLCKVYGIKINAHDALSDADGAWQVVERFMQIPVEVKGVQQGYYGMSEVDKVNRFLQADFIQMNGDGSVFISEKATQNRDALRIVMEELWRVYVDGVC